MTIKPTLCVKSMLSMIDRIEGKTHVLKIKIYFLDNIWYSLEAIGFIYVVTEVINT